MHQAVIVIGSSYGDEGKGLAAAHAAREARESGHSCLNVLINGGPQRGHTVDLPDGRRHIFHHFGAGAAHGADSYADEDFIVNPLLYMDECAELEKDLGYRPILMGSARCRVTLPFDMMLGQIIEENRGAARHGSCGCGVYETRLRYEQTNWALPLKQLCELSPADFKAHCQRIAGEYIPARLAALDMTASPEWIALLQNTQIIDNTWADLTEMRSRMRLFDALDGLASSYDVLVFECGQGLALDEDNQADFPHLTPSKTTSERSVQRIAAISAQAKTELRYVTRTYLTRHGAGPFPSECPSCDIAPDLIDRTNIPNPHQQTLRYGRFDGQAVLARIEADAARAREVLPHARTAAFITHLNETGGELCGDMTLTEFSSHFDRVYLSDTPFGARLV